MANYSKEQEARLRLAYDPDADQETRKAQVATYAETEGFSTRSVISKLQHMGIYKKLEYVTKRGAPVERKAAIVADLAALAGVPEESFESLEKATKNALNVLRDALRERVSENS